jgi:hypothetical protein
MSKIHRLGRPTGSALLALTLALGMPASVAPFTPAHAAQPVPIAQETFATPEAGVDALVNAMQGDDTNALHAIFGPAGDKLVESGDPVADKSSREHFLAAYTDGHALVAQGDARQVLTIGKDAWPLPIPLIKEGERWRFDSATGAQEIVDRRIGRNELKTIQTLLAAVAAEQDYFDRVKRGTGTGFYAERFFSHEGEQDGLYWPVQSDEAPSPLAPLVDQAIDEGYPGAEAHAGKQIPYHGYYFRILKAQGKNAPGGARDYVKNGELSDGFAIAAWPAEYETSGVMTFLVDQDGVVFQKDLGSGTEKIAGAMHSFDPDITWARVDVQD